MFGFSRWEGRRGSTSTGGRKFMSTEVVARILKGGTLRPGPRDVPTALLTLTAGQVGSGSSQARLHRIAFHLLDCVCVSSGSQRAGRPGPPAPCLNRWALAGLPTRRGWVGLGHRLHLMLISPRGRGIAITAAPSSSTSHRSLSALTCFLTLHGLLRLTIVFSSPSRLAS